MLFRLQIVLLCCLLLAASLVAQARNKRLVLKDGSFQAVKQWEMKGDRVRYYSAERFAWEEMPNELVDWAATEKYNADLAAGKVPDEVAEENAEAAAEEAEFEAVSPQVAPGLRLPEDGGVWLLDRFQGEPQLVEMVQSGSEVKKNTGKNILRAVISPLATSKQSIELEGRAASIRAHELAPVFYADVPLETDDEVIIGARYFTIVRLKQKKDSRQVGDISIAITGRVKQKQEFVPTKSEILSPHWVKITPEQPLTPGEYAIVEILGENEINTYVWDFAVDPAAPANATAWKPQKVSEKPMGTDERPAFKPR